MKPERRTGPSASRIGTPGPNHGTAPVVRVKARTDCSAHGDTRLIHDPAPVVRIKARTDCSAHGDTRLIHDPAPVVRVKARAGCSACWSTKVALGGLIGILLLHYGCGDPDSSPIDGGDRFEDPVSLDMEDADRSDGPGDVVADATDGLDPLQEPDPDDPSADGETDGEVSGDPIEPLPFPPGLPPTQLLGESHGFRIARAVIHVHSIYSHDACDGHPTTETGEPNLECLANLRDALCADRIDFVLMSEHYDRMADTTNFEELFLHQDGDLWIDEGDRHSANAISCDGGHRAHIMPGLEGSSENVSPLGLMAHPVQGFPVDIENAYRDDSAEGLERLRDAGAVLGAIHIESADPDWLDTIGVDAFELTNLHVLIGPDYREVLGLEPTTPALAFVRYYTDPDGNPPADLVFLEFHERFGLPFAIWDRALGERLVPAFLGNDAHQNVANLPMGDGDRPDSYRRMFKWAANHVLVTELTPAKVREALAAGRLYMVHEVLGSPVGFDFYAERLSDEWLVGASVPAGESQALLRVAAPTVLLQEDVQAVSAPLDVRLVKVTSAGTEVVAEGPGDLAVSAPGPGRYRVEVDITPTHLVPFLGEDSPLVHSYPWIISNPIEIE